MKVTNLHFETWKTGEWMSFKKESWDASNYSLKLDNEGEIVQVKWMAAGHCKFALKVNGVEIEPEDREADTAYTYDITANVNRAKGAVNVYTYTVDPTNGPALVRGAIELQFKDGRRRIYGTCEKNWRSGTTGEGDADLRGYPKLRTEYPAGSTGLK